MKFVLDETEDETENETWVNFFLLIIDLSENWSESPRRGASTPISG